MANKPAAGKWSKQEILGHLIDSGRNNLKRFDQALRQMHLIFDGYDQDDAVVQADYQEAGWQTLVDQWASLNRQIVEHVASISEDKLSDTTQEHNFHKIGMREVEKNALLGLGYLVEDYLFHLEHHISQILPGYERVV